MRVNEVSMMYKILVIISRKTLSTPVGHPLGVEKFSEKNFRVPLWPRLLPKMSGEFR
jgi:hypothetical protein